MPKKYKALLDPRHTEKAIGLIKDAFQTNLAFELDLTRVTAPLFVEGGTGVNDDLNGIEKPVSFAVKGIPGVRAEVVQSLAKWKRMALADLGFAPDEGLYTDMNAVRPDEILDSIHSLYVDQWDWERVMTREERNVEFLKKIVRRIYDVIRRTEKFICHEYDVLKPFLPEEITFFHSEELQARFPKLTPKERETMVCREHGAVFVIGIGGDLKEGQPHDGRAPDYDDWTTPTGKGRKGLNGDIVVYHPLFDSAFELSSMGIRVDREALLRQLDIRGVPERKSLLFHRRLLNGELPLSIGGGIGQSRLCMLYLQKAHIGEIQAGMWPKDMVAACRKKGIFLL
ncbi:MAG: aspartate--ammonia ligase [Lentisphaerae bacterium RIFOXYB12_FULL_65_16]|nr:MAG: aspartate--ammonia ligase [Lentisphaerae bacterium RIFOXYA12_64_32]OGV88119.1 MAG: aspartate--ammonia ligase [Lentisphaerae bacterium RIFOXYB12_FULL_65_16]